MTRETTQVELRPVEPGDLDAFFAHQQDEDARRMAAFTSADPADRAAFDAHWAKLLDSHAILARTIMVGGSAHDAEPERRHVAGHIVRFPLEGRLEVTYWIDRAWWGRGVATAALRMLLTELPERPVAARAAADNAASIRVLEKLGFRIVDRGRGFANARGEEIDELVLELA